MGVYQSSTYLADLHEAAEASVGLDSLAGATVLIAGAGGLLGSFAVDTLAAASAELGLGLRILATDRSKERLAVRFAQAPWEGIELAELDVCNPLALEAEASHIVHLASNADPRRITADPVGTIRANVDGTTLLLDWGLRHGCARFLYVSSGEVYGTGAVEGEAFVESHQGYLDPLQMRSCYPLSKRMAENVCVSYARQHGVNALIVRPSHAYGPVARSSDSRANAQFVAEALAGRPVVLKSAGSQVRSYTYVADTISGMLSVLCAGTSEHAYNLANRASTVSIAGFAHEVCAQAGVELKQEFYSEAEQRDQTAIERQVLDPSALESLGWRGGFDLARGVRHTLQAMREM